MISQGSYMNRILRVDLSSSQFKEEELNDTLIMDYIGGRGFGSRLLFNEMKPGIHPWGEENVLIFISGPLAGTNAQSFGRFKVFFKSPLTGGYFKSSGGGYFAPELKYAGFDVVIIYGKAPEPVYLWINNGKYELRRASYLWGLDCDDTHTLIREELGSHKVRIACIGPAGESGVKYSGIFSDRRAAARGGGGAVMGAKNLKALAVKGSKKVELADPDTFRQAVKEQVASYKKNPKYREFSEIGTQNAEFTNILGMFPTKNFREGYLPNWERIEGPEYTKIRVRKTRCHSCMLHCGSITKVQEGKYAGSWTEGPEYETIWAFTGSISCSDVGLTVAADKLCDDLGLDTISTAVTIGFAYELFEKGLISIQDTGGLELVYGNDKHILELIRMIAYREDFGDLLAEGTRGAARKLGQEIEEYAMHVKGLELPGYDPRGAKAQGLNLLTMTIGADHCSGFAHQELFDKPFRGKKIDRFAVKDKGELTKYNQDIRAVQHLGIMCNFGSPYMELDIYGQLLSSATGRSEFADPDYLMQVGERVFNLERMFNYREGFDKKDDRFPRRFVNEPLPSGPSKGQVFEEKELLADYYQARGWDPKTGIPTTVKLRELGLGFTQD